MFIYIFRCITKKILIGIGAVALIVGAAKIGYTYTIRKQQVNAERKVFKNTVTYTEQTATNLTKYYKEYNEAKTESDKEAIRQYVVMMYPNIDTDTIENQTLKSFYNYCLNN
ncbi:MAG: hypothetical protein [Caudoviricetes sp.]|nr:MAG: hypothetical protein [Caudoviricetes sp.]